ncbi:MAG TPA: helix-turn-helix domain-containing protein [Candidatus Saccharimonadales bacterium]
MENTYSTSQPVAKCPVREQACVARAAAIVSSKWTPQLIYALHNGVQRFCELQKEAGGINPRTLSARLEDLVQQGIIQKNSFAEVPPRVEYSLTPKGRDLIPILECMVEWGEKHCPNTTEQNRIVQSSLEPQSVAA